VSEAPSTERHSELIAAVVDDAVKRYFAVRREKVPDFVARRFGWLGALRLHRNALGWDLLRAPSNLVLAPPVIVARLTSQILARAGIKRPAAWMDGRRLLFQTSVAREVEWLIQTELLELPYDQGDRTARDDALMAEILVDTRVSGMVEAALSAGRQLAADPEARRRLDAFLSTYGDSRAAASDIANTLINLGTGALVFQQMTPTALSLGPAIAGILAQQLAIASFPLGAGIGGVWYGFFPATPSIGLVAGATGGLMIGFAVLATFAGVVTDPVQRHFGLHERRLRRMLAAAEQGFRGGSRARFAVRDHYIARLADLFDVASAIIRSVR